MIPLRDGSLYAWFHAVASSYRLFTGGECPVESSNVELVFKDVVAFS